MSRNRVLPLVVCLLLLFAKGRSEQIKGIVSTGAGESHPILSAHRLSWWMIHPLRLDAGDDLMIGSNGVTAADYRVEQDAKPIGTLAGHRILQLLLTIRPSQRILRAGYASDGRISWKTLLVQTGLPGNYVELYRLQAMQGTYELPFRTARIYGSGSNAILTTYDPDSGNGGGCAEGYWWFDDAGPHAVDFSPLYRSIMRAIPAKGTFTPGCWALHPETSTLTSWVQRSDAECHACGGLGEVEATYKIRSGKAEAEKVEFHRDEE